MIDVALTNRTDEIVDEDEAPAGEEGEAQEASEEKAPSSIDPAQEPEDTGPSEQEEHDDSILDDFFPHEYQNDQMRDLVLDRMSLTTLKFMKKAGSGLVKGILPEDMEDAIKEIAVYLLAHDRSRSIKERSKLFRLNADDLELELDEYMHGLPVRGSKEILRKIADQVAKETATLAVPEKDKDKSGDSDLGNA